MKVNEIMTGDAKAVRPENTLVEAAEVMRELDVGGVPVCDGRKLRGMLTDRDIAIRAVADGRDPRQTRVRDTMSDGIVHVFDDQDVEEAARLMAQHQIRRLPVIDHKKQLVGIVSLGDLSVHGSAEKSAEALRDVSEPSRPKPPIQ